MTTQPPTRRPIRVVSVNKPTPEQAQVMIRAAAVQIAALLGWAERQRQQEAAA